MKIKRIAVQVVAAREIDSCARYGKGQRTKLNHLVFQVERARHARYDLVDFLAVGQPLPSATQTVDEILLSLLVSLPLPGKPELLVAVKMVGG